MGQLLLGVPLAGVQGHRHVHAQGICSGKVWRQLQLPVLQCVLHAHEAICLGCGQRCQVRQLQWHIKHSNASYIPLEATQPRDSGNPASAPLHEYYGPTAQQSAMAKGLEEALCAWQIWHCGGNSKAVCLA